MVAGYGFVLVYSVLNHKSFRAINDLYTKINRYSDQQVFPLLMYVKPVQPPLLMTA